MRGHSRSHNRMSYSRGRRSTAGVIAVGSSGLGRSAVGINVAS